MLEILTLLQLGYYAETDCYPTKGISEAVTFALIPC